MAGRIEDEGFLRGETAFVRDLAHDDCSHVTFVRSHVASGRIERIDVSAAAAVAGVSAVLTANDLALAPFSFFAPLPDDVARPPLAQDRVRMVGELIAVVVADTPAQAVDAAELVEVDISPEPAVVDPRRAGDPDSPPLFDRPEGNVVMQYERGRIDDLFEFAGHVERGSFPNQRLASAPMEPCGAIARPTESGLDLWATGQGVHTIRHELAQLLDVDEAGIRVRSPAVGGGFGGRHSAPIEILVLGAIARHLQQPVRWDATRTENLLSMVHGRAQDHTVEIGFDDDGLIVGLRVHNLADCGAYAHFGPLMPFMSRKLACGPYRIPRVDYSWTAVATNTNPVGPYRGAGQPEATNGVERTIENAARSLGIDPIELRRRNMISPDELPFATPTKLVYDSGDYAGALERAADLVEHESVRDEQARRRAAGDRVALGVGFASYISYVAGDSETGLVEVGDDGAIGVRCGTFSHGQAHRTTVANVVSGVLGVDSATIAYRDDDSDALGQGGGTGGSRSAMMAGGAAQQAADEVLEQARGLAAELLEADPADIAPSVSTDGVAGLGVIGVPSSTVTWAILAAEARSQGSPLSAEVEYEPTDAAHPSGTHASVVEVDLDTGAVTLRAHVAVDDCGTVLNPPVVDGQQHGGAAAGIGQALFEEIAYDSDGNPRTVTFGDYLIPSAAELPSFLTATMGIPSPVSVTGAKGIGENGAIASPTAVQNAAVDALSHLGVTHIDLPMTPERVWQAITAATTALES
ncbi:MAG: xanthine dehydrogenase family protein molybdopterin-binding subunit [Actinomycetota bacterium]|jgi:aerobic carbon-monoxide dehydrogenase large subunit|nr:xanthine dehydrogenase family protein molybdopterin-binding subunit [Actinomycetota bacterium]